MKQLTIAGFDRYDFLNNPKDTSPAFTIWFSGCTHKCAGCQNPELWDSNKGDKYDVYEVYKMIKAQHISSGVSTVVLLGGEPTEQDNEALSMLCGLLKGINIKIWLYTGYTFGDIHQYNFDVLKYIDVVKCGKYEVDLAQDGFPASSNQRVYERTSTGVFVDVTDRFR